MKFLYMDETYPDQTLPRAAWAVCLTGLLVPAERHPEIRERFYAAIGDAVGRVPNTVPTLPEIHAAHLLPEADDDTRVAFLEALADIVVSCDLRLYRVGYVRTRSLIAMFKSEEAVLGLAFSGLLHLIADELAAGPVWPVMETNQKALQDQAFAGAVQFASHIEAHIGPGILSRDQSNLGEVLYCTKRSVHGAIVDCSAYLLNIRTVQNRGLSISPYKNRLAAVAERLAPAIRYDEIIPMRRL